MDLARLSLLYVTVAAFDNLEVMKKRVKLGFYVFLGILVAMTFALYYTRIIKETSPKDLPADE